MPVIFLRYKPDSFKRKKGDTKKYSSAYRKKKLLEWLKYCSTLQPSCEDEFLRVIYLFYSDHDSSNIPIKNIELY